jgi:hypothetical protein
MIETAENPKTKNAFYARSVTIQTNKESVCQLTRYAETTTIKDNVHNATKGIQSRKVDVLSQLFLTQIANLSAVLSVLPATKDSTSTPMSKSVSESTLYVSPPTLIQEPVQAVTQDTI